MKFYFVPNRLFYLLVLVVSLVVLFMLAGPVLAQDVTPVIPPDVIPPEDAFAALLVWGLSTIAAFANGLLTATIVSILKFFLPTDAAILKNIVGAVLTILYWVAVRYGFEHAFESVGQFFITVVPALVTLLGGTMGSVWLHEKAVAGRLPLPVVSSLLAYKRHA